MLRLAVTGAAGARHSSIASIRRAMTPGLPDWGSRAPAPVGGAAVLLIAVPSADAARRPSEPRRATVAAARTPILANGIE